MRENGRGSRREKKVAPFHQRSARGRGAGNIYGAGGEGGGNGIDTRPRAFGNREDGKIQVIVAITGATSPRVGASPMRADARTRAPERAVSYPPGLR